MKHFTFCNNSSKISCKEAARNSRRDVRIVLKLQRLLEQQLGDGCYRLDFVDEEPSGEPNEHIGKGNLGHVLLALLGRLEAEIGTVWRVAYYGPCKDGLLASVYRAFTDDQQFFNIRLAD